MNTFIEIENLDRVKGINLQDSFGTMWYLDSVINGRKSYKFHFNSIEKGNRMIELKREMHDAGCWKISSYRTFHLVSKKTLKDPVLMISVFSNLLA